MSRAALALLTVCLTAFLARAAPPAEATPPREVVAFVGVHVLPMGGEQGADEVLRDHTLLVRDGLVAALGPRAEVDVPDDARVLAADGAWVLPGLMEMHGHLPGTSGGSGASADDILMLYLANGVTSVRGMLGAPAQLALRDAIAAGERAGPRLLVGSPPLHGGLGLTPEGAAALVAQYADAGYDHLKVHEGLSPEVFAAIADAARERGLRFGGHVADAVGLWAAVEAGQGTVDHMDNVLETLLPPGTPPAPAAMVAQVDRDALPALAERLAAKGAAVVPTQALWATIFGGVSGAELRAQLTEVRYMPRATVDQWQGQVDAQAAALGAETGAAFTALRRQALAALAEAGVPVLLGTDSPQLFSVPGFSIHREIAAMRDAGLSPAAILDAGTAAVARFYGDDYPAGRLAVGRAADLLLLDGDPRADLSLLERPRGVLADGRWWSRERLDEVLADIERRHAG